MTYSLQILRVLPETILTVFGLAIMLLDPFVPRKRLLGYLAPPPLASALGGAGVQMLFQGPAFNNQIVNDEFAIFFRALFIFVGILVVCSSFDYLERDRIHHGEYYAL